MFLLSGCVSINNVNPLHENASLQKDQAIVIYGIGLEAAWTAPKFKVKLDEYNIGKQSITGNCTFYNRMEALVPSKAKNIEYFAFDVPSGYYTYSGFNVARLNSKKEIDFISNTYQPKKPDAYKAYKASVNRISYIGDFIYTDAGYVVLRRDLDAVKATIKKKFPNLKQNIELADSVLISQPNVFLCTP